MSNENTMPVKAYALLGGDDYAVDYVVRCVATTGEEYDVGVTSKTKEEAEKYARWLSKEYYGLELAQADARLADDNHTEHNPPALRVWHKPQVPCKSFYVAVPSIAAAALLIKALWDYDAFQYDNNIKPDYCNVSGLEAMVDGEWEEWEGEFGESITDVIREEMNKP